MWFLTGLGEAMPVITWDSKRRGEVKGRDFAISLGCFGNGVIRDGLPVKAGVFWLQGASGLRCCCRIPLPQLALKPKNQILLLARL